jgi:hypothetical protein
MYHVTHYQIQYEKKNNIIMLVLHADNIILELFTDQNLKKSLNNIKIIEDGKSENIANIVRLILQLLEKKSF